MLTLKFFSDIHNLFCFTGANFFGAKKKPKNKPKNFLVPKKSQKINALAPQATTKVTQ